MIPCRVPTVRNLLVGIGRDTAPNKFCSQPEDDLMPCPYYWWALVGTRHPINFGLYQKMISCRVPTVRNLLVGIGRDTAPNKFWFISEDDLMPCPYSQKSIGGHW
ncbi:hypothetical protein MiSe_94970 [Microseira wollei NIES-4236]|uniref:Uncharacterized protein n=2 Tax=Microseira wollei TaxID=467598 RepID=A0AAV3WQY0_9CYAN|nr:hypothetical protein MiSe_94970 [Microseira wollei NIES-4236]